jgi:predicted  nucleic acid-binding Zn-ribbon protein
LQRRIQERFNEVVQEELGISDDQARQLRDLSVELMERRRALATRHGELQERLAEVGPASTDAEARQVLDELRSLHRAEADLVAEEIDRLLEVIEPAGVARFYALRQRMMQRIEARRGGAPGPAGPFRGGPGMRPRGGGR